jgi:hypothetical protein
MHYCSTLKKEKAESSGTLKDFYSIICSHIPWDSNLHYHAGNLKSYWTVFAYNESVMISEKSVGVYM